MNQVRRLLPGFQTTSAPTSVERLKERGFEAGLKKVFSMTGEDVISHITASGLKGRGGAAFPTGLKWSSVYNAAGPTKYVVMNADESELGTFKDRVLLEEDPLGALSGVVMAAHVVGAKKAYCYIRGEYRDVERRMAEALQMLRSEGWVGTDGVDIEIRRGAGAYIAGEETALFNSIEGKRPEPRVKPPFPTIKGLWGSPTLIQNVETLANVAILFAHDTEWFKQYGTKDTVGTKLVAISGHVQRPGVYEVPFGMPLTDILEAPNLGGGVVGSGRLGAILLGGAAGTFLSREEVASGRLDYGSLAAIGASIGSGAVMVFDDTVDLKWVTARLARFFAEESCGQCVPCRVGTQRIVELIEQGGFKSRTQDLRELGLAMRDASICGLGQTAPVALLSLLDRPGLTQHA